jgi:hypothetical protein
MPEAIRLTARPGESAADVLARCPANAVAFAFHLNATFSGEFPHRRRDLVAGLEARGIVLINAQAVDISKRTIQAQCAEFGLPVAAALRDGDGAERLIVKTNHNYGGYAERQLTPSVMAELGISPPSADMPTARSYKLLPRREIPEAWWADSGLAIERYIANRQNRIYRITFAGRRVDILRMVNSNLIKKPHEPGETESITILCDREQMQNESVPGVDRAIGEASVRFMSGAKLDFAALDLMADDAGRAYVLDVNTTPYGVPNSLRRVLQARRGMLELVVERAPSSSGRYRRLGRGTIPPLAMLTEAASILKARLRKHLP